MLGVLEENIWAVFNKSLKELKVPKATEEIQITDLFLMYNSTPEIRMLVSSIKNRRYLRC
jgi:hypothetical protein